MNQATNNYSDLVERSRFSLVSGGLLFRLLRKAHLCGENLDLVPRRIVTVVGIAWLPLFVVAIFEGNLEKHGTAIPFLFDIETHVRFLIALPILIAAEVSVHTSIWNSLERFLTRRIILEKDLPAFRSAIDSALRLRDSVLPEIAMIILVYTVGHWIWRSKVALADPTWYATLSGSEMHLRAAGYWYILVSLPILRFFFLRWYFRLFIWFRLLWRISRLNLQLDAAHPDRAGGINFVGSASYAFAPILIAQGAVLAGVFADRVILEGQPFLGFKVTAACLALFWVLALLAPLCMFTPQLWSTKRRGQREYGLLASLYLAEFRKKWMLGVNPKGEDLLGTADIQSLADMGNSYDAIRRMRLTPFGLKEVTALAAMTLIPLLPLTLTAYSADQLVGRVLKMIFL